MHFVQRCAARGVKLSLREPLAREDCAIAQSFLYNTRKMSIQRYNEMRMKKGRGKNDGEEYDGGETVKLILAFMFPVLCGNLFQNFYNIVDSMIVGRFLGVDALAAVGSTTSLNFLVVGWITGMTSGFGILISQAYGAKDEKRLKHYVAMSTYLCIALAVVMTVGLLLANGWI